MRGADEAVCGAAHLTLPDAIAPGPLPLPPKGRRGAVSGELAIAQYSTRAIGFGSPDSPVAKAGIQGHTVPAVALDPRFRGGDYNPL